MFHNQWGPVTAGEPGHFNICTIGWGSFGTIWGGAALDVYRRDN